METKMGENHKILPYISEDYIHRKHKIKVGSNPLFTGSKLKEATTP
jgi:hypothetical protein